MVCKTIDTSHEDIGIMNVNLSQSLLNINVLYTGSFCIDHIFALADYAKSMKETFNVFLKLIVNHMSLLKLSFVLRNINNNLPV